MVVVLLGVMLVGVMVVMGSYGWENVVFLNKSGLKVLVDVVVMLGVVVFCFGCCQV